MEDKQELTLGKYSFQVKNRNRARGAVLLDTSEGPRLMREYERIRAHFTFENEVKERLAQRGMALTDRVVNNIEGNPVTEWESGEKFVVYQWYYGDSCDYRSCQGLEKAARNLGQLHRQLQGMSEGPVCMEEDLFRRYERRNREMKRVYHFMKGRREKMILSCVLSPVFRNSTGKQSRPPRVCRNPPTGRSTAGRRGMCAMENIIITTSFIRRRESPLRILNMRSTGSS